MDVPIKKALPFVPLAVCAAALAVTLWLYAAGNGRERRVMYFGEFGTDRVFAESRFVPEGDGLREDVETFVEELLLGPATNRLLPLFNKETSVEFCIVRDRTAFVGLSKKALFFSGETADIRTGTSMLRRNIVRNFTSIDTVEVYVDGIAVSADGF